MSHVSLSRPALPGSLPLNPVDILAEALEELSISDWSHARMELNGQVVTPASGMVLLAKAINQNRVRRGLQPINFDLFYVL